MNQTIGIITMHKVRNFGSALQAYALQSKLFDLGFNNVLIDYIFPNKTKAKRKNIFYRILHAIFEKLLGNPTIKKIKRFNAFYEKYFICTVSRYSSPSELLSAKFDFGTYITGSDQVWNPTHIKDDPSFFLPFAPENALKISYASSFSKGEIDSSFKETYAHYLKRYNFISVREFSGIAIVKVLTGKDAVQTCDPTLLLSKEEWNKLLPTNIPLIKQNYILIYILQYSYNPYPEINKIISDIQSIMKLPIVIINGSIKDLYRPNCKIIKDSGPIEFLNLIKNASFLITTSFHGTAFALNFNIPFYSVIKGEYSKDTRMIDLLSKVGAQDRAITYNDKNISYNVNMDYSSILKKIQDYRTDSIQFLKSSLK